MWELHRTSRPWSRDAIGVILSLILREHRVPFYSLQTSFIPFQCVPVCDPLQKLSHQQEAPETAL